MCTILSQLVYFLKPSISFLAGKNHLILDVEAITTVEE